MQPKIIKISVFYVALLSICGAIANFQGSLIDSFIAALNDKDPKVLETFLIDHFDNRISVSDRMSRLEGLVKQGAPFKVIKLGPADDNRKTAVIEDRNGEQLGLILQISSEKISGILIDEPSVVDAKPPKDYSDWKSVQDLVDRVKVGTDSVGLGVAYWQKEGKVQIGVSGVREINKPGDIKSDDVWNIGSVTKPMTATMVGLLVQRGDWSWKTTLKELFPNVPMKSGYENTTLEQIVRHRGGIPEDGGFRGIDVKRIVGEAKAPREIRENYVKDILGREPISEAGTQYAYSNAGYALLSAAIERKFDKPFAQVMKEQLFDPLGMTSAQVGTEGLPLDRPVGHVAGPEGVTAVNFGGPLSDMMAGAGNVYCSLKDLVTFCQAHLDGLNNKDGLLKATTVKALHKAELETEGGQWYAAGWGIRPLEGTEIAHGHNGSNGTFYTEIAIFPSQNLIVVSAANEGDMGSPSPSLQAVTAIGKRFAPSHK